MKLNSLILQNFRSYKDRTEIPFSKFTSFIGKNDVGKSTVLEALDIFFAKPYRRIGPVFDNRSTKSNEIDDSDVCIYSKSKIIRIGVVFSDVPDKISTGLDEFIMPKEDYLLNSKGMLEIHLIFDFSKPRVRRSEILCAHHPSAPSVKDIWKASDRRVLNIVRRRKLDGELDLSKVTEMRRGIYRSTKELNLRTREFSLNTADMLHVWFGFESVMPLFALFQSDRSSSDQNPEIQKPLGLALDKALNNLQDDLASITERIQKQVEDTASRTIKKLNEGYPEIASNLNLETKFPFPEWRNSFKIELRSKNKIPLSKRGSGLRRLVLLSFFQAEAEGRRERESYPLQKKIIYAIEEPETSQHPDFQKSIVDALRGLEKAGDQVIITTHVPGLAKLCPTNGLCFIDFDQVATSAVVRNRDTDKNVLQEVVDALGILPDPVAKQGVKVAVLVEGKTDIDAIRSMILVLQNEDRITKIDENQIFWAIGGGCHTLQDWCERKYLDKLNVPVIVIQDSDIKSADGEISEEKRIWLDEMNSKENYTVFITNKRCIDNYVHPDALSRIFKRKVKFAKNFDLNFHRIHPEVLRIIENNKRKHEDFESVFTPFDHEGNAIRYHRDGSGIKAIICAYAMRNMTASELYERATYMDGTRKGNEVKEWIDAIQTAISTS